MQSFRYRCFRKVHMRRQAGRKYDHTMYSMYIEADKFHQRLPVHTSNNITNSSRQQLHLKGQFLLSSALKIIICNSVTSTAITVHERLRNLLLHNYNILYTICIISNFNTEFIHRPPCSFVFVHTV